MDLLATAQADAKSIRETANHDQVQAAAQLTAAAAALGQAQMQASRFRAAAKADASRIRLATKHDIEQDAATSAVAAIPDEETQASELSNAAETETEQGTTPTPEAADHEGVRLAPVPGTHRPRSRYTRADAAVVAAAILIVLLLIAAELAVVLRSTGRF